MNVELPIALVIMVIGLGVVAFCAKGISRELRTPPTGKADLGLVALASIALLVGAAIVALGALYIHVVLYSTDL